MREYSTQRGELLQTRLAPLTGSEEATVDGAQGASWSGKGAGKVRDVMGQSGGRPRLASQPLQRLRFYPESSGNPLESLP